MKIRMICFSRKGIETGKRIRDAFLSEGNDTELSVKSREYPDSVKEDLKSWTGERFKDSDVLVFIGSCGIAVRSIAPFVNSKETDPAVLVADECGKFVISLLSGHLGGANEFAVKTAEILGAVPVITTATDVNGKFAVDVFARKNQCSIFPMEAAKAFSANLISGKSVGFYSEFPVDGEYPSGVYKCELLEKNPFSCGAALTIHEGCRPFRETVTLVPKCIAAGIGCRRGQPFVNLREFFFECLKNAGLAAESVSCISSIDLKKEEEGLKRLSKELNVPFVTFSSDDLQKAEGDFNNSDFVRSVTGVGNVCERSAVLASSGGKLLFPKKAENGMTCAFACADWRGSF